MELNNLNILKPKSEEDIVRDLNKLTQEEKNRRLIETSIRGQLDLVKLLIKAGASVNVKNKYGYTALMYASINNHLDIVKLLIKAGADINIKNNFGFDAIFYANDKIKDLLLQKH